jgi:hypothetical protein
MLPSPHAEKIPPRWDAFSLRRPSRYIAALSLGSPRRLRHAEATTLCNATAIRSARDVSGNRRCDTARKLVSGPNRISTANHVDPRPTYTPVSQCVGSRDEHARRHHQNQRRVANSLPGGRQQGGHHRQFYPLLTPASAIPASINPCHMSTAQLKPFHPSAIGGT